MIVIMTSRKTSSISLTDWRVYPGWKRTFYFESCAQISSALCNLCNLFISPFSSLSLSFMYMYMCVTIQPWIYRLTASQTANYYDTGGSYRSVTVGNSRPQSKLWRHERSQTGNKMHHTDGVRYEIRVCPTQLLANQTRESALDMG